MIVVSALRKSGRANYSSLQVHPTWSFKNCLSSYKYILPGALKIVFHRPLINIIHRVINIIRAYPVRFIVWLSHMKKI
jgi:hypothetical protein